MQTLPRSEPASDAASELSEADRSASSWQTFYRRWPYCLDYLLVVAFTTYLLVTLRPNLLFNPNMDVGGDNAAHVAAVYYFVHTLLPSGQLSGWDPQWFGGFPLYVFYFPLPALLVAAASRIVSFAVAFKLVTVLGTLSLPGCAYTFGRLGGFRRPAPVLFAAGSLPFLVNWSYTLDGGNIASTLAGEFSYSLACSTGLLFLGFFLYALRTGRGRATAALLLGVTFLCHVVPALFFSGLAVVFTLTERPLQSIRRVLLPVGVSGILLVGFWLVRFGADLRYTSSMNYSAVGDAFGQLFPIGGELVIQLLAAVGLLIVVVRKDPLGAGLAVSALAAGLAFVALPTGIVWSQRWLPFWFLMTSLLAGYAVAQVGELVFSALHLGALNIWITASLGGLAALCGVAAYVGDLPFYATPSTIRIPLSSWISWNYSGYQAKSGWPEFVRVVTMLDKAGSRYGCGRLDYEYTPNVNLTFGSTIVEMSFPMWTDGCIDSAEGVYYESSTSTPFHFLDQSELSLESSDPVGGLPYKPFDLADGIAHLQLTGVKYFLADSPLVESAAAADPSLVRIASTAENPAEVDDSSSEQTQGAEWVLYLIKDSPLVTALTYQPVVESGLSADQWLQLGISWYQQPPADWRVPIALSGPASWRRADAWSLPRPATAVRLPDVSVRDITTTDHSVSFRVSRPGVPVLVKVPYFPNWHTSGASGPYEATPNLMVVVPTRNEVTLNYGATGIDWLGRAGSLVGLGGLVALRRPAFVPEPTNEPEPPNGVPHLLDPVAPGDLRDDVELHDARENEVR